MRNQRNNFLVNLSVLSALVVVLFINPTLAQDTLPDSINIVIMKEYRAVVPDANKWSDNPTITPPVVVKPNFNYSITDKKINTGYDVERIPPARMVGEPLNKLYHCFVKAGMGNYTTPMFDFSYNTLRSKQYSAGLSLHHLSSSGQLNNTGFSGYSDNEANVYGKYFLKDYTLSGDVDYKRKVVHYYGFNPTDIYALLVNPESLTKENIKQTFNYIGAKAELSDDGRNKKFLKNTILHYHHLIDINGISEDNAGLNLALFHPLKGCNFTADFMADYYNNRTFNYSITNTILGLKPQINAKGKNWKLNAGINGMLDLTNGNTAAHIYPAAEITRVFADILFLYGGASGKVQKNSFKTLTDENPFFQLFYDTLKNSNQKWEGFIGFKGKTDSHTNFNFRVSGSQISNMPFFVNDDYLGNRFAVVYDDVYLINARAEVGYKRSDKLNLYLKGDYFHYIMKNEQQPWHRPPVQVSLAGDYLLTKKIILKTDIFFLSSQYARDLTPFTFLVVQRAVVPVKLKATADINLGFEYRHTARLSGFINLNNIAAFRYERWYRYPTQRFNFIAGLSYSF